ncbi:SGNH/GDSL hydrolase family protein [Leekyejoonella antrihumi]|uniref:SGNH/GDSL hydrolase family protein n=1 Tax=Leekyejoonella antrihumi TaxID=1660198 RepID=A0A563DZS6_9MICO|nr:SGNH/GDSL hydrolase family protein [Leekyejoonella antrihumi]TWP35473.1 SGNH/GDSL hydrolase family protein [Leekyejoonella antrihumi]
MTTWERYVAIGDSFTEGMSDPDPTRADAYLGWADRLAAHLAAENATQGRPFGYANLAVRGRLIADVVGPQLDAALELAPDLVSMVGGGNDSLRPKADLDAIADQLEAAVVTLRAARIDVLLATSADPGFAPVMKAVRPRAAVYAANVFGIAQRHGCYVLDQWSLRSLRDARMWAPDRLHLTTEGHQRVAAQAAWALGERDGERDWAIPLPPALPLRRREALAGHAVWAKEYLAPWVQRRMQHRSSGDDHFAKRPHLDQVE